MTVTKTALHTIASYAYARSNALHVNIACTDATTFTRKYGQRVKEVGGTYSACRGYETRRTVLVPLRRDTKELINAIIHDCGHTSSMQPKVILRLLLPTSPTGHHHYRVEPGTADPVRALTRSYARQCRDVRRAGGRVAGVTGREKFRRRAAKAKGAARREITDPLADVIAKLDDMHLIDLLAEAESMLREQS